MKNEAYLYEITVNSTEKKYIGWHAKPFDGTYLHYYTRADNNDEVKLYPSTGRNSFRASHPYLFKFAEKDKSHTAQYNSQNYIVYRYADLLLMLAEISNELSKDAEAMGYVEQVLSRVGLTPHISYQGGQASFRDAIMREYRFELASSTQRTNHSTRPAGLPGS